MEPILIVLGIILVIVVGGGLWLYAGRRRGQVPDEISAHKPISVEDLLPSEGEDAEEAEGEAEPAATLESPESIPGRMQRLRARLAGAGGFGKAVLSVLSRGDLTEEDWEEIEDTLLTSDLGIEVTTSLMDELRTQAKLEEYVIACLQYDGRFQIRATVVSGSYQVLLLIGRQMLAKSGQIAFRKAESWPWVS